LAEQLRMTSSDLKWPFQASRAITALAELLVNTTNTTAVRLT